MFKKTSPTSWLIEDDETGLLTSCSFARFSNFHAHVRTGNLRKAIATATMRPWKYLLVMPNTGPIDTLEKMVRYRDELTQIREGAGLTTEFIMTIYLTEELTPRVVYEMAKLDFPCAVKYYPPVKGATTGSGFGIPLSKANEALRAMEQCGVRLLGHFESVYDGDGKELPHEFREGYFMEHEFYPLRERYRELKITIEHVTTALGVACVTDDTSGNTTCTITPQAMLLVRKDLNKLTWGVHGKCMPIAKTERDRNTVLKLALSGDPRAYLGDDTAPHPAQTKHVEFEKAANGCYLPHSPALYASLFLKHGKLENLEAFASFNGPRVWGLPLPRQDEQTMFVLNTGVDRRIPQPTPIPESDDVVIPFGWSESYDALYPELMMVDM